MEPRPDVEWVHKLHCIFRVVCAPAHKAETVKAEFSAYMTMTILVLSTLLRFSRIEAKAVATAAQALSLIRAEHCHLYLLESVVA